MPCKGTEIAWERCRKMGEKKELNKIRKVKVYQDELFRYCFLSHTGYGVEIELTNHQLARIRYIENEFEKYQKLLRDKMLKAGWIE